MTERNAYRRENLAVRAVRDNGHTDWEVVENDGDADGFELYTADNGHMVDFFDNRQAAEEYLELIAV